MNKVMLMGRLTRDPQITRNENGGNTTVIARYTLAVDRRRRNDGNGPTADFIGCVVFGKGAEFAEKYLKKGTKIAVSGHIQTGSYTNKDGNKVYTTDVVVEEQNFAESKRSSEANAAAAASAPAPAPAHSTAASSSFNEFDDSLGDDEELPFN